MTRLAEAQAGIRELHARYSDATFRKDYDAFAGCFTPDGEWRISGRVFRGRAEIRDGIAAILDNFIRVLITFRTPILTVGQGVASGRTYVDERCAWKNGNTNIALGIYYEHFVEVDGLWLFSWRLFQRHYTGAPDMTGTFDEQTDYGPPPAMPPLDAQSALTMTHAPLPCSGPIAPKI
jgi:SnoaL-like domain